MKEVIESMAQNKRTNNKTDWGDETVHGLKIVGRVTSKALTWTLNVLMTLLLIALITGTIVGIAFLVYVNNYIKVDMSDFRSLTMEQDMTTRIYYMDYTDRENRVGTPIEIEDQQLFSNENRTWVSYDEIPKNLIEAFISIEDERFWTHNGVDWRRTGGAVLALVRNTDNYGGSTITQQLIKNITGENEVTIQRKVKEIVSALELEKTVSKEQILEMYLNTINLSEHCYGIQAAATAYFDKDVSQLNLVECAALASIPKSPTKYDPYLNPENNADRRKAVLTKMRDLGKISEEEYQAAWHSDLEINDEIKQKTQSATTSWYTDAVIDDAIELLMEKNGWTKQIASQKVYTGGYNIYTVMDPKVQTILEDYFKNDDNFARINNGVQPEASMVVMDPKTGDILGIAGGRGEKTSSRLLNYATQTTRSPGSSIKPVCVYGPALEYGIITYSSVYEDSPVKNKWPANYPAGYDGPITIHRALAVSKNTIAVKVLLNLGFDESYDFAHNKLGMKSIIDEYTTASGKVITDLNSSALALGGMNYGVTLRELTSAYQIFANKGIYNGSRTIIKILDNEGNVVVNNQSEPSIVMSEQNASIMTIMMKQVVNQGTATKMTLRKSIDVAGKTGTTSDDNDRWFIGYTPYYLGGVWFGYSIPMALTGFSETASPALMVWDDVMKLLHEPIFEAVEKGEQELQKLETADGVISCKVCTRSGLLPSSGCSTEVGYFTSETVPKKRCTHHGGDDADDTDNTTSDDTSTKSTDTSDKVTSNNDTQTTENPVTTDDNTSVVTDTQTADTSDTANTETSSDQPTPPEPPEPEPPVPTP